MGVERSFKDYVCKFFKHVTLIIASFVCLLPLVSCVFAAFKTKEEFGLTSKVAQVFEEDRGIYDAAAAFMEAGDWVTSLLCGEPVFGAAMASAKALWSRDAGYPDAAFFAAFHPDFAHMPASKLADRFGKTHVATEVVGDHDYSLMEL